MLTYRANVHNLCMLCDVVWRVGHRMRVHLLVYVCAVGDGLYRMLPHAQNHVSCRLVILSHYKLRAEMGGDLAVWWMTLSAYIYGTNSFKGCTPRVLDRRVRSTTSRHKTDRRGRRITKPWGQGVVEPWGRGVVGSWTVPDLP